MKNILITRGKDYVLRAFLNVCRHRGATLCSEPSGKKQEFSAVLIILGAMGLMAPYVEFQKSSDCHEELVNNDTYGLEEVHLQTWHGMIWLNFSEKSTTS
ncbi:hypothetical protein GCM10020331_002760 [Ectobacillus funiculus]